MSKAPSFGRNAKLLCPECGTIQVVKSHDEQVARLSCFHDRTDALLPANGVSLEQVAANTPEAKILFPVSKEGKWDATDKLLDEASALATREGWK